MKPLKILIADPISSSGIEELARDGALDVQVQIGLPPAELIAIIPEFSGLVVRSETKVTSAVLEAATKLRVVGRAGVGIDNVDVETATRRGVIVMNAPGGNTVSTAEHAFSLLLCAARKLPQADAMVRSGKWSRKDLQGVELYNKTLGIIGMGRIGSELSRRAIAFGMRVLAFDPYLAATRARTLQVELVQELDDLLPNADFITLHTPLTDQTRNILGREALAKAKPGVRIINCARGGLIDEAALKEALDQGHVAGAALDVFVEEPANASSLFGTPGFVATPHLGASTTEAQVNVAIQVAEQMSEFLTRGGVTNALNMPSLSAEEAPRLKPYMALAEKLGSLVGQLAHGSLAGLSIEAEGAAAELNLKPITGAVLAGFLRVHSDTVNMVNAPFLAKERGLDVREIRHDREIDYHTLLRVSAVTSAGERSVSGTLFGNSAARLVEIFGIKVEAELEGEMIYIVNEDAPGFIGRLGTTLGEAGVNIGTFHLGRREAGGEAVALVSVDGHIDEPVVRQLEALPGVKRVTPLRF